MPFGLILTIANFFGISVFRLVAYAGIIAAVLAAGMLVRHHYVAIGYNHAISDVKKQDNRAVDAATQVEERAAKCDETNGFWDVITQNCKLQTEEQEKQP